MHGNGIMDAATNACPRHGFEDAITVGDPDGEHVIDVLIAGEFDGNDDGLVREQLAVELSVRATTFVVGSCCADWFWCAE